MKINLKKQVEDDDNHVIFIDKLDIPKDGSVKLKKKMLVILDIFLISVIICE